MAESPRPPDATPPAIPRSVKGFGVVAAIVVLLFLVLLLTGGHGPSRHSAGAHATASFDAAA